MRYYSLQILGSENRNFSLNQDNPWGINLSFNIKSFSNLSNSMPTTIELLNAPLQFFTDTENLKGAKVILTAGIKPCGYTQAQKLKIPMSFQPLLYGQINSSFANWELTETRVSLQINGASIEYDDLTFTLNRGDVIANVVSVYLNRISSTYNMGLLFKVDPSAYNEIFQNSSSIPYRFVNDVSNKKTDLLAKASEFLSNFGLLLKQESSIITIYRDLKFDLSNLSIVTVDPSQLITQPVYSGPNQVTLELGLDSRISLGSLIFIPTKLNLFSGSLLDDVSGVILRSATDAKILKQGYYRALDVMHTGDSRNLSAKAWSTYVRCSFTSIL